MKTWLLFLLMFAIASSARAQSNAVEAKKEAVRLFPDLVKPGSDFNALFLKEVQYRTLHRDPAMSGESWPVPVAFKVGAALEARPNGAVTLREMTVDIPSFRGKTVMVAGTVNVSDYFNYSYRDAGGVMFSFQLRDEGGEAYIYGERAATAPLQQLLLTKKPDAFYGIFLIQIRPKFGAAGNGVMADIVKVLGVEPKLKPDP